MRAYVRLRAEIILWFHYCVLLSVFSIFQQLLSIGNNYSNGSLYKFSEEITIGSNDYPSIKALKNYVKFGTIKIYV